MDHVKRIILYQIIIMLMFAGAWFVLEFEVVASLLIGSGINTGGTGVLAAGIFSQKDTTKPEILLQRFYIAELLKIFLILGAFSLAFLFFEQINPIALFGSYFVSQFFPTALASLQGDIV
ncbi:hypothetical protein TI04_00015 [Achromatium sp. WMS2]|nr:hypothetical protein TI04_00015 [Achromatium sp. WMS2]